MPCEGLWDILRRKGSGAPKATDGPATEVVGLVSVALSSRFCLKSRTDVTGHFASKGQGGVLDAQALHTPGMPVFLRDISPAGCASMEPGLARHYAGVMRVQSAALLSTEDIPKASTAKQIEVVDASFAEHHARLVQ
ncbi:UNVERIFIED_CONTAM: hypothetical protein FKN15_070765 [Acipenser sinensis]